MWQEPSRPSLDKKYIQLIYAFPAIVAFCVVLARGCRPLLPYRPEWTKRFIEELQDNEYGCNMNKKSQHSKSTGALLISTPVGLVLQIVTMAYPSFSYLAGLQTIALVNPSIRF